jgi:hypothetical protein
VWASFQYLKAAAERDLWPSGAKCGEISAVFPSMLVGVVPKNAL